MGYKKMSINKKANISSNNFSNLMKDIISYDKKFEKNVEDCMIVEPVVFWTQIFAKYFLNSTDENHDDMLFYVKIRNKVPEEVEVYRQYSTNAPGLGDPLVEWNETVFLNMILHQVDKIYSYNGYLFSFF